MDLSRVLVNETKRKVLQQGGSPVIKDKQERAQRGTYDTNTARNEICHLQSRPSRDIIMQTFLPR
jgi:hypothetical protein